MSTDEWRLAALEVRGDGTQRRRSTALWRLAAREDRGVAWGASEGARRGQAGRRRSASGEEDSQGSEPSRPCCPRRPSSGKKNGFRIMATILRTLRSGYQGKSK